MTAPPTPFNSGFGGVVEALRFQLRSDADIGAPLSRGRIASGHMALNFVVGAQLRQVIIV